MKKEEDVGLDEKSFKRPRTRNAPYPRAHDQARP
jgi:hypothetical protein